MREGCARRLRAGRRGGASVVSGRRLETEGAESRTPPCLASPAPDGGRVVTAAFGAAATPRVPDAVSRVRAAGRRAVVAAHLLAPGYFHDRLGEAGADAVTDPLLPHPLVARIALDRLRSALAEAPRGAAGGR